MVSSASVTGSSEGFGEIQEKYFERIALMKLKNLLIVGFGIQDSKTFSQAANHSKGAIIGSAFIKMLSEKGKIGISAFVDSIRKV